MTRWSLLVLALIMMSLKVSAQQQSAEDKEREKKFQDKASTVQADTGKPFGWAHSLIGGANLTQASFTNWVQGGQNALSYQVLFDGNATQNMERTNWSNTLKLAFGQSRLGDQGVRKTDDEIYFETVLIYKLGMVINPYASATARTQFARGFAYDAVGNGTEISAFMDPGFFTQSVGAAYTPAAGIKTRLGLAMREIITTNHNQYTGGAKSQTWGGAESVTDASWNFAENMVLTSRLELFAPFKSIDQVFVRFDNSIAAKVNKWVSVNFNVQLMNDVTVSPKTQVKEVLAIGISYQFI
jgi:hypothetical protein